MTKFTFITELFADVHKDAYGFRPSVENEFYTASDERKQELWDQMIQVLYDAVIEKEARQAAAEEAFGELVKSTMQQGAVDRDTAIRWILEGEGVEPEITKGDYVAYCFGLPYGSKWVPVFDRVLRGMRNEAELLEYQEARDELDASYEE